ncbi:MAG: SPFH domain-containing protein [Methylovulum sp.]|uniref:SPFH domain-containing protein n=1 Tax=Methylovulum sp. TaxID=1916980 RepID=UPI00260DFDA2|nr:SPFH domain-containing protein [Methylovulum sp.]MDD2724505.1 SPFH domain-containing protein [Methylovulum sp.]MDD5124105.1 SPFH domain-containing protein [Methylovulum sp.]
MLDETLKKLLLKNAFYAAIGLAALIVVNLCFGINDAGERTVVQYPTGQLFVKFSPGIYFKGFGNTEIYSDVATYDFDKGGSAGKENESSLKAIGVAVRYQDGGTGTVFGKARFALPTDDETMIRLHKDFRNKNAVAEKLIRTVTEESMNLTAGLMTSEEAYAEKRGIFTQWAEQQVASGKFFTELKSVVEKQEATNEHLTRNIPVIKYGADGLPLQHSSDFKMYGIKVNGFQLTDWDFEKKTLDQISRKREATMGIITAKADAERARQEALTAEEQGKKNVMVDRYTKEQEKIQAVVDAEKEKEVAVTKATQAVLVAEQGKLEAEQKRLAAIAYKQEQILRGEGDGEYKRLVMSADGALATKLEAWKTVHIRYAEAIEKQKWVPEIQMGGNAQSGGSAANDLIELLKAQTAKELKLDMSVKGN